MAEFQIIGSTQRLQTCVLCICVHLLKPTYTSVIVIVFASRMFYGGIRFRIRVFVSRKRARTHTHTHSIRHAVRGVVGHLS
jgi:hypothetical protein